MVTLAAGAGHKNNRLRRALEEEYTRYKTRHLDFLLPVPTEDKNHGSHPNSYTILTYGAQYGMAHELGVGGRQFICCQFKYRRHVFNLIDS